jgi:dihydroorotase-like cyclic amidohydrolase
MKIFGNIVEIDGLRPGVIEISDGIISSLDREPLESESYDQHYDLEQFVIFPGFVDLGATCVSGVEDKRSASLAALNGGITYVANISGLFTDSSPILEMPFWVPTYELYDGSQSVPKWRQLAITPHHLYFNLENNAQYLTVDPPLFSKENQETLLWNLELVEFLVSGHIPHLPLAKIRDNLTGVPNLDTFGSFIAWLMSQGIDPVAIFNIACNNPGGVYERLTGNKVGRLIGGYEASFTVLNLTKKADEGRPIMSRAGWSAFDLRSLPGIVETVYYRGEKVIDGQWLKNFKTSEAVS